MLHASMILLMDVPFMVFLVRGVWVLYNFFKEDAV